MVPASLRPLSVGEILDVSFTLYRRHFAALGTIAVLCSGIPVLLGLYIEASGGVFYNLPLTVVHYVAFTVLSSIATAATVFVVSESYLGRPLAARDALRRAAPLLTRLILCSLLLAIIVGIGFIFFFLPELGLYVECTVMRQALTNRKRRKALKARATRGVTVEILFRRDFERLARRWQLPALERATRPPRAA